MKYALIVLVCLTAVFLVFFGAANVLIPSGGRVNSLQPNDALSLLTEPADGIAPVLEAIDNASASVDLVIYEMDDVQIEDALVAAKNRGVSVRVLLSQGYYGKPAAANVRAYEYFQSQQVSAKWTSVRFALTHEKAMVIDGDAAFIMTFNLMPRYYATSRDFGIIDRNHDDVAAILGAFDADWRGDQTNASSARDLVWSPGAENETVALIGSATGTLDVYNEEMADGRVVDALESAAQRGATVRVLMTYSSEWKPVFQELTAAGVEVRTYSPKAPLYIHAKMILVDGREAFIGSQNFSGTSQNENRELGILATDSKIIRSLSSTFAADWKNADPFR